MQMARMTSPCAMQSGQGRCPDKASCSDMTPESPVATLRREMTQAMETGVGIYRKADTMKTTCDKLDELRERYRRGIKLDDASRVFNTEWMSAIELGFTLDVAQAIAHSAMNRRESRGAHQRLDEYRERDDSQFLSHSLARYTDDGAPRVEYQPVVITKSQPCKRVYGGAGKQAVLT